MHHEHSSARRPAGTTHSQAERRMRGNTEPCHSHERTEPGILIARDGDRYRLLHGQLRLAAALAANDELCIEVRGEGLVRILKEGESLLVEQGDRQLPLCRNA